jgi:hypothetical protein
MRLLRTTCVSCYLSGLNSSVHLSDTLSSRYLGPPQQPPVSNSFVAPISKPFAHLLLLSCYP